MGPTVLGGAEVWFCVDSGDSRWLNPSLRYPLCSVFVITDGPLGLSPKLQQLDNCYGTYGFIHHKGGSMGKLQPQLALFNLVVGLSNLLSCFMYLVTATKQNYVDQVFCHEWPFKIRQHFCFSAVHNNCFVSQFFPIYRMNQVYWLSTIFHD